MKNLSVCLHTIVPDFTSLFFSLTICMHMCSFEVMNSGPRGEVGRGGLIGLAIDLLLQQL